MHHITYIIADDHLIFRQGLKYALADDKTLKLVSEADNGRMLLQQIAQHRPDVVLLDLKMPEMDGIEATREIHALHPAVKILMLTSYSDEHFILHLLEQGINGYLLKNAEPDEIKKAIHSVYDHDYYFNQLLNNTMLRTITRKNTDLKFKEPAKLNDRETNVLQLICQEKTTAEIAAEIFLSLRTVEGIRTTLIEKLGVRNTAGLVIYAIKHGVIR
jgi:DNA-binding NarL/FixJ family response regulator